MMKRGWCSGNGVKVVDGMKKNDDERWREGKGLETWTDLIE